MNLIFYFENKIILSNKISKEKKKKRDKSRVWFDLIEFSQFCYLN